MVVKTSDQGMKQCDCLTLAVRDLESFARGPVHRSIEHFIVRFLMALSYRQSGVRLLNLSLGRYQLKVSTVARYGSIPFEREDRWLRLDKASAKRIVTECFAEATAERHARRRIAEALAVGRSLGLNPFEATAMVYAGEMPTTLANPYQTRLRARYQIRHRSCDPRADGM
jgi:hypothetical protein